jgi:FkbM family methyltransferase
MSVIKRALSVFTGNGISQSLLEYNVRFAQYLMGVGAGTRVHTSGEMSLVRYLNSLHGQSTCVFDVGANIGQFASLVRGHCDISQMQIHSFEPSVQAIEQFERVHGDCPRIRLNRLALGASDGAATLYSDRPASGLSSLTKRDLGHIGKTMSLSQPVQVRTLDGYCEEHRIERIHLLKIDVEGHEREVLEGSARMFGSQRIDAVTFEFGGCNIDTRTYFRDFYRFFSDRDMQIFRITPRGYLRLIAKYRETHEQFLTTNFMAVRRNAA